MKRDEQGIALVITLFLMASLSALAVSMMFLSQTETASSRNYRTMSQARYASEAGVHKAINYLNDPIAYGKPNAAALAAFDITKSPVTCVTGCTKTTTGTCDASTPALAASSGCVVLVANFGGLSSNYPDAAIVSAFSSAAQGTLAVNSSGVTNNAALGTVRFGTAAILLTVRPLVAYGGTADVVQTWQIVADGSAGPSGALATVEVAGTFEKSAVPAETFAVFATDPGCGAITYQGNGGTDSYNSHPPGGGSVALSGGLPVVTMGGGAIGTNGNLSLGGTVDVWGTLSTPRAGVGSCTAGAITAITDTGNGVLHEGTIPLAQSKTYPTPVIPLPGATDLDFSSSTTGTCVTTMLAMGWSCSYNGATSTFTIAPISPTTTQLSVHNLTIGSNKKLVIAGTGDLTINANSFTTAGTSSLSITNNTTTLKLKGQGVDPVMDMQGNFSTSSFDPWKLQILYDGTGTLKLRGSNELAATVYAPNAHVDMASGHDVYGSILAASYNNSGGAKVHYDTSLSARALTISNPYMSSFTWKKY